MLIGPPQLLPEDNAVASPRSINRSPRCNNRPRRRLVHIAPIVLSRVGTTINSITMVTTHVAVKSMMLRANLVNLRVLDSPS
jgi:hypothetical protein